MTISFLRGIVRALGLAAMIASSAQYAAASTIGVPVDALGSNTVVAAGNVGGDGTIRFFIPLSSANSNNQILEILVNATASTFWARLTFATGNLPYHSARNTEETLLATLSPVPLPAALPLFAAGLAGLGLAGTRRRRKLG